VNNPIISYLGTPTSDLNMNGYNIINPTSNLKISSSSTSRLEIGNDSPIINIGTDTSTTTNITIGASQTTNIGILLNCPLTPVYNSLPSTGQLGDVITFPTPGNTTFISGNTISNTYSLTYGVWYLTASIGIYVSTTGGTLTRTILKIYNNGDGIIYIENNGTQLNSSTGYTNVLNGSGFFQGGSTFNVDRTITFSGGEYKTTSSSPEPYVLKAVRIG
jgi:hypothetical protein